MWFLINPKLENCSHNQLQTAHNCKQWFCFFRLSPASALRSGLILVLGLFLNRPTTRPVSHYFRMCRPQTRTAKKKKKKKKKLKKPVLTGPFWSWTKVVKDWFNIGFLHNIFTLWVCKCIILCLTFKMSLRTLISVENWWSYENICVPYYFR